MPKFQVGDVVYSPIRKDIVKIIGVGDTYRVKQITRWNFIDVGEISTDPIHSVEETYRYEILSDEIKSQLV